MENTTATIERKPDISLGILSKGLKVSFAFEEIIQNAIAATDDITRNIKMCVKEVGNDMIVRIMDNGHSIIKTDVPDMMDIGVHRNKSIFNENGVGMKGYIALNNPSDCGWKIYAKNSHNEMFVVHGEYLHYKIEDITTWPVEPEYNFLLETIVEKESEKSFTETSRLITFP